MDMERISLIHAYAFGGPELAIKTINETFGLNIKDFATVNFSSLPKIIDILGGIDIDIDSEEINYINDYIYDMNKINKTNVRKYNKDRCATLEWDTSYGLL